MLYAVSKPMEIVNCSGFVPLEFRRVNFPLVCPFLFCEPLNVFSPYRLTLVNNPDEDFTIRRRGYGAEAREYIYEEILTSILVLKNVRGLQSHAEAKAA